MNDGPSPMSYMGGEGPSLPKRKKMRQKYAPKACVSCRRSKLKCTGEVPCQRCVDNGKRCFYSEDQTAAEVLQNLSRPTPTPTTHMSTFSNGNGHVAPRLAMPQNSLSQRRPSDNGPVGMSMEQRMARMEAMMEALVHDRGLRFTPTGSLEREESVGHRSESAFSMPILDPIHPALDQMVQQLPEQQPVLATDPSRRPDAAILVRIGGQDQTLPFPDDLTHVMYVSEFFGAIEPHHPCVDETDFHTRTKRIVTNGALETTDVYFLALSYIVFACSEAFNHEVPPLGVEYSDHPGWRWYLLADGIIDKKSLLSGSDDLTLIQYLLFQSLYFAYADMPALAYSAIRTTCTIVVQQNLHQQSAWNEMEAKRTYQQICVIWCVVILDRAISLSCGRPASLNMADVDIEMPCDLYNRLDVPSYHSFLDDHKSFFDNHTRQNVNALLQYQLKSTQLANSLLSELRRMNKKNFEKIQNLLVNECGPGIDFEPDTLARNRAQSKTLKHFMVSGRIATGLAVGRQFILSLEHDQPMMEIMSNLACDSVRYATDNPGGDTYRLTSIVAVALLAIGHLVLQDCSDHPKISQQRSPLYTKHVKCFLDATGVLYRLAIHNLYARRVRDDFSVITNVVDRIDQKMRMIFFSQSRDDTIEFDYEDARELIPSNILDSFPYTSVGPDLSGRSTVLWLF